MRRIRVIPALLMKNGGLVKTIRFSNDVYVGDPINTVKIFNEKEVDEILLHDISATPSGKGPDFEKIADIASESFMPMAYGGGIRNLSEIDQILKSGIEKVSLNSITFDRPDIIAEASQKYGSQSVVVSIDVKKDFWGRWAAYRNGGKKKVSVDPVEHAKQMEKWGAGEIIVTAIDRDGTFEGYDTTIISKIAKAVQIPVIACGGARTISDFKMAVESGASAVAAGSMFIFQGVHRAVLIQYPSQEELKAGLFQWFSSQSR